MCPRFITIANATITHPSIISPGEGDRATYQHATNMAGSFCDSATEFNPVYIQASFSPNRFLFHGINRRLNNEEYR
ncbi:hypothetical protein EGR_10003 [Echinococcus granulosus]|uniref:Uncharacterized protein n=1 Tax=Echinococcus granulosus TaxID=6210 RepID=W6U263_ECHGR|nr:hypothetical protein EGR_10003 [Echinococcus granulosus]EUB55143.1 hypothetical protein EGR_10003 [Echinococcus granulosus]